MDLCKDIEIISGLKIKHLIFDIKYKDHDLISGLSFLKILKFYQNYKPDKVFGIITYSQTINLGIFHILSSKYPAN